MAGTSWAYFAGLVDGEGCISVTWQYHNPKNKFGKKYRKPLTPSVLLWIGQKESVSTKRALESCQQLVECGSVHSTTCRGVPTVRLEITGWRPVGKALRRMLRHLIVKKVQARILLKVCSVMELSNPRGQARPSGGGFLGYPIKTLLRISKLGDALSLHHARQIPRKWTFAKIKKTLGA